VKNLEQIRAKHALSFWNPAGAEKEKAAPPLAEVRGEAGGDVVSKLPALIMANGLLATLAFAKSKGNGYETLMVELCRFLCDPERRVLPDAGPLRQGESKLDRYIRLLADGAEADSQRLQQATAEALAYLGYLKRFAP
jgi:CRISPR/Cas system CMR-associated protein Cmr5 small subunit